MRTHFTLPVLAVLALALTPLLVTSPARAGTERARIGVSVLVNRRATIRAESMPAAFIISADDIKRGYLERRHAARLLVENSRSMTFAIEVFPTARLFSEVQITTSSGTKATLGADGGQLVGRLDAQSPEPLALDFRFRLPPGIEPGRYPWPVRLEVRLDY